MKNQTDQQAHTLADMPPDLKGVMIAALERNLVERTVSEANART